MNQWISVADKLPDQEWVLMSNGQNIWIGQIDNHFTKRFFCKCCLDDIETVTHWMKLPEPPK